jgi:hypothetical protein
LGLSDLIDKRGILSSVFCKPEFVEIKEVTRVQEYVLRGVRRVEALCVARHDACHELKKCVSYFILINPETILIPDVVTIFVILIRIVLLLVV